ncbi:MAG: hypothetical protein ACREFP_21690 [Acetobacteraceae bacterium]
MAKLHARLAATWLAAGIGVAVVAGCAPLPQDIKPATVSAAPYESESCTQLAAEQTKLAATLAKASVQETKDRQGDDVAVIAFGMPLQSWLGGNEAKKIAELKGQQAAVAKAEAHDSCLAETTPSPGAS